MTAGDRAPVLSDVGKLVLRLIVGLGLMTHGYPKLFGVSDEGVPRMVGFTKGVVDLGLPFPEVLAWAAAITEFGGGLCFALGLFTRVAAFLMVCTMGVALYRHRPDPFARKELALLYLAPAFFTLLSGPGRFSLDALLFKKR